MTDGFQRIRPQNYRPPTRQTPSQLPPRQPSAGFAQPMIQPTPTLPEVPAPEPIPAVAPVIAPLPEPTKSAPLPHFELDLDGLQEKKKRRFKPSKKQVIVSFVILLVIGGFAAGWFFFLREKPKTTPATAKEEAEQVQEQPEEEKFYSVLTGVETDKQSAARPVTAIMIENSPDARPQSGLLEAGVVYEAIAEGGITRFLTLFQDAAPDYIGPVRSVRPYFLDWAWPFDGGIAHVGGSRDALEAIQSLNIKDLDQFTNDEAYWRIEERFAPHNVYTSFEKLDALNKQKGYTSSTLTTWARKQDVAQTITARSIDITISGFLYNPNYEYDKATNSYLRSQGGEPHRDEKSGDQLSPKVVITMAVPSSIVNANDGVRYEYSTSGSGEALVFQDGIVSEATWSKASRKDQVVFTDKNGLPFVFNKGQTWISVVSEISDVEYTP